MLPILQIGPLTLQTPGLIILFGLWIGVNLADNKAKYFKVDSRFLMNMITI